MKNWSKAVCLAMLLLFSGAVIGCSNEQQASVKDTVTALEKNDPEIVWSVSSEASRKTYGEEGIKKRMQDVSNVLGIKEVKYHKLKLQKDRSDDNKRVYDAVMVLDTEYGEIERPLEMTFVPDPDDESKWLIDWTPAVILPGLTKDNGLQVESLHAERGTIYDRRGEILAKDEEGVRKYPYGAIMSPAVGFVRGATAEEVAAGQFKKVPIGTAVGRAGLEMAYDKTLRGKNGVVISLSNKPDKPIIRSQPVKGKDIHTTLDLKVQNAAYAEASGHYGAVVAMEPKTGQVLALVDGQSFEPSEWLDSTMDAETYKQQVEEGVAPLQTTYASIFTPGSVQKLFTSIIGLNDGVMTFDTYYNIYGSDWQPDNSWGGYHVHRVTPINGAIGLEQALISSDNIFFSMLALNLGGEKLVAGLKKLGYTQEVPGPLPIQTSQITAEGELDPEHQTGIADTSFGQYQIQMSPFQMCMTYCLLANGGQVLEPRFLLSEEPKVWLADCTSQENIDFLNKALRQATAVTHPNAERDYAAFTGKTGTAEVGPDGSINLGWYVGYDQQNPTCTMAVMINGVQNVGGSDYNTGMFGRIMDALYADGAYQPGGQSASDERKEDKTKP